VSGQRGGAAAGPAAGYLGLPVGEFLDALSATAPGPSGGAIAALAVAFAAGLCVMVAGLSTRHLPAGPAGRNPCAEPGAEHPAEPGLTAEALAQRAGQLSDRVAPLADADAEGYRAVLAALRARDEPARRAALSAASAVPMQVTQIGAEVAGIAAALAARGNPRLRGDAITAALLAAAGSRAAAVLVRINLVEDAGDAGETGDARPGEAERLAADAARLASEAERAAR
jgi:formiminotetrahydrofolate cyclodeaminase